MKLDLFSRHPETRAVAAEQLHSVLRQERADVTAWNAKVECPCGKTVRLVMAFKCLYCGVFFCQGCGETHFGKTREQYFKENPL